MLFSIIIPVYNAEDYLNKCLESVIQQTYKDLEIIIVNDGSTDNSGIICNQYASKDCRVKVFHKKNEGVSAARNLGLANASGTYIVFVDSDDWIDRETISRIFDLVSKTDYDSIIFGYVIEKNNLSKNVTVTPNYPTCNNSSDISKCLPQLVRSETINPLWNKIFKKSIILKNSITFDESIELGEDLLFNFQYFQVIESCFFSSERLYHYKVGKETSLTNKYKENKYNQLMYLNDTMLILSENKYDNNNLKEAIACIRIKNLFSCFRDLLNKGCTLSLNEKFEYISCSVEKEDKIIPYKDIKTKKYKILAILIKCRNPVIIYWSSMILNYFHYR